MEVKYICMGEAKWTGKLCDEIIRWGVLGWLLKGYKKVCRLSLQTFNSL